MFMKIVNYHLKAPLAESRIGVVLNKTVFDLHETHKALMEMGEVSRSLLIPHEPMEFYKNFDVWIRLAQEAIDQASKLDETFSYAFPLEEIKLNTPVPSPSKIICIGTNYADHVKEMGSKIPDYPVLFSKFTNALIGPEDLIYKNDQTEKLDYEVELAVIIGKRAKRVSEKDAFDYVAGYTIANDTSARDLQKRTPQWLQGKTQDHSTPVGPWLVTKDEITNPGNLAIQSFVNGEKRQSSNTKHLIFDIAHLIHFISYLFTLEPGDLILTGTPDGVGMARNRFLQAGDQVTLEIEGIGAMTNKIVDEP